MTFAIYMVGVVLVAVALGYGAHLLGAPAVWIGIGAVLVVGMGLMGAARRTREPTRRD